MSDDFFGHDAVQEFVEQFCEEIPLLLGQHQVTADLVPQVVSLSEVAETPFTVAIVGQMRVGKSTLINALVGKDLAVTGVTETTATINWFHYGDDSESFRVQWKDRPAETFPRSALKRWVGDSELAAKTRHLEFYDCADFLKVASIVDTPGLRSVLVAHEDATTGFLGLKRDEESRSLGSQADAIVYVLMPVAGEKDESLLSAFRDKTRLPGSSSYNSIAVLHKWETLDSENPHLESQRKADRISKAFVDSVCDVLPVSAPLAIAAKNLGDDFWRNIIKLSTESESSAIEYCLESERKFKRKVDGCGLTATERCQLLDCELPWPSLKMIIRLASQTGFTEPEPLRNAVKEMSQIEHLHAELDRRFFSRSRLLKVLSVVSKAKVPCQLAQIRLQNERIRIRNLHAETVGFLKVVEDRVEHGDSDLLPLKDFLSSTRDRLLMEDEGITNGLARIGEMSTRLTYLYTDFHDDMSGLEAIEGTQDRIETSVKKMLQCLFGINGPTMEDRLQFLIGRHGSVTHAIDVAIGDVRSLESLSREPLRTVYSHGVRRLEQLANQLDAIS